MKWKIENKNKKKKITEAKKVPAQTPWILGIKSIKKNENYRMEAVHGSSVSRCCSWASSGSFGNFISRQFLPSLSYNIYSPTTRCLRCRVIIVQSCTDAFLLYGFAI